MTHLSPRRRLVAGVLGALLLTGLAGCAPDRAAQARWVSSPSTPSASPSAQPQSDDPDATPSSTANPGGGPHVETRTALPTFGPPPVAIPPHMADGASAAWFSAIPTTQQVAFLTIDDGFVKDPRLPDLLRRSGIRVTLFLEINAIKDDPDYFKQLEAAGAVIEAHTITHPDLVGKSYDFQHNEICGSADQLATYYGRRPKLFRPPYGNKDATTLKVVHDCGMKAAFFWRETVDTGIVRYQAGSKVKAGDIILMHFRPAVIQDFTAALWAIKDAGLTPALLEDYITGDIPPMNPGTPPPVDPTPTPTPTPTTPPDNA